MTGERLARIIRLYLMVFNDQWKSGSGSVAETQLDDVCPTGNAVDRKSAVAIAAGKGPDQTPVNGEQIHAQKLLVKPTDLERITSRVGQ